SMHAPSYYDEFDSWKAGYEAGAAKGAEDMRERAAIAGGHKAEECRWSDGQAVADAIRALPITQTTTEGERG
ncbi:MAG TPA: hypothetical protein VIY48_19505, partial [Candidatus Paceibacterota bacterium]